MKAKSIPLSRMQPEASTTLGLTTPLPRAAHSWATLAALLVGWLGLLGVNNLEAAPGTDGVRLNFARLTNGVVEVNVPKFDELGPTIFHLEKSDDLLTWTSVATNVAAAESVTLTDPSYLPGLRQRFYRVAMLPETPTGGGSIYVDGSNTTPPFEGTAVDPFPNFIAGYNAVSNSTVLRIIGNGIGGDVRVYSGVSANLTKGILLEAPNGPVLLTP